MGPGSARLCRLAGMTSVFAKNTKIFIPAFRTSLILLGSSSHRERGSRRCFVGKDRRLRRWANVACRPGRFRPRVPLPHYERCVLDEHIGGTGEGRPPACRGDVRRKCRTSPQPGPSSGTDGNRNRRTGGAEVAPFTNRLRGTATAPRLPDYLDPHPERSSKERQIMARRRMPGVATEKRVDKMIIIIKYFRCLADCLKI